MPVSTADLADSEGPSASVPFGEASQVSSLQRSSGALALGGSQQQQPQGQPPGQPQPQQGPQPASQPQPLPAPTMGSVFSSPRQETDNLPWRQILDMWATHPKAGPALRHLANIAMRDQQKNG